MYITVPTRSSSCVKSLHVDGLAGRAVVEFKDSGEHYEYEGVSRRAILNVLFNPDVSLGFWVNNNLTNTALTGLSASSNRPGSTFTDAYDALREQQYNSKLEVKLPSIPSRY